MYSQVPNYEVRVIKKEEVPQAFELWRKAGMHEGAQCLYTWMEADPQALRAAVTKEGKVLGVCAGHILHEDLGFIGHYVVAEEYRGLGIGIKLWNACMKYIGDRNAGVNGVPGMYALYRDRGGFPIEELTSCCVQYSSDEDVDVNLLLKHINGIQVHTITDELLPRVHNYDRSIHGYRRDKIIKLTMNEKDTLSITAFKDDACVGYGIVKLDIQGHKYIGPFYADKPDIAEVILRQLIETFPKGKGVSIVLTPANKAAIEIAKRLHIKEIEEETRLYSKYKVQVDHNKIFAHLDMNFTPY